MRLLNRRIRIKLRIIVKQNAIAFAIFTGWFALNFIIFLGITKSPVTSLLSLFYFVEYPSLWGHFYPVFSEFVIFGLIFTLITVELFRKYNPKETCRLLAAELKNHIIIISYTNLAKRIKYYLDKKGRNNVIIEEDEKKVEDLIQEEQPLIVDEPADRTAILDARIYDASLVLLTEDDIELLFSTIEEIRELNPRIKIIARCFEDNIAAILEKNFKVETLSTSKFAAARIIEKISAIPSKVTGIAEQQQKKCLIIGLNHVSERVGLQLASIGMNFKIIDIPKYEEEGLQSGLKEHIISGDPRDSAFLLSIGIEDFDIIVMTLNDIRYIMLTLSTIRELNKECRIITRVFSDDLAKVLARPPFDAITISSTKEALDYLIQKKVL
ncbi:MAG: hypothetical protein A2Y62_03685 [Candidatus Fischerbacteria bacterium RBG_13_37_8]|uniref:RCK N-terminal domain-containing protein n=1 Tax=Candidatus Fischerbacteria bacterium RBG_13_37_8 TaxID=1817863 RepID=A0A1F5V812_9BACT|nr:MAG: hypothetical protein A2Y62_03685 [Candidatus Fischerbacteria bacterium RBG_13_37_8]